MPMAAAAGSAFANWHGMSWDIQRLMAETGRTTTGIACAAFAATAFVSPFAAVVAELPRRRALAITLLAAVMLFAGGYKLGKSVFIVMYA